MIKQQRTNLLHLHVLIFSLPPGLSCTGHKATLMPGLPECKGLTLNCQLLPSFVSSSLKLPWNHWQNLNGLPKCILFRPLMKFSIFIFQPHKLNIKLKHLNKKKSVILCNLIWNPCRRCLFMKQILPECIDMQHLLLCCIMTRLSEA